MQLSTWDRPVTNKELDTFYGKEIVPTAHEEINEVLTNSIRHVNPENLSLPMVTYTGGAQIKSVTIPEVIEDYGFYKSPMVALMAVLSRSECPLVAAYRKELADVYAYHNADEIDAYRAGEL